MDKLPCVDCTHQEKCDMYATIDRTLNKDEKFAKMSLKLEFMLNPKDTEDFKAEWNEILSKEIGKASAAMAETVCEIIDESETRILPLGARLDVDEIENKDAFDLVHAYIKETHDFD